MKIARNVAVSGRHVEWYAPNPGSLSEGAAERSEAEGVYPDERKHSKISEPIRAFVQIFGMEKPSDDTPSVTPLRACQLPQRGSREWLVPFNRVLANIRGYGRFSSPLRKAFSIQPAAPTGL